MVTAILIIVAVLAMLVVGVAWMASRTAHERWWT